MTAGWRYAIAAGAALGVGAALCVHTVVAQQAGQNVNVLPAYPIGNTFPPSPVSPPDSATAKQWALKGDNYLQRQVEPTVAASTLNGDHFLAAFGDYRPVDFASDQFLPGHTASGWIGYSRSYDRGKRWYGAMVPGFPGGTSQADLNSPLHGLQSGSDAVVATTPGGHFYLGGLFFAPGALSNIAVMHLRDVPSLDGGDSIQPGKITIVDKGSNSDTGNFEDKPSIGSDIARNTTDPSVCGPVYMAYTIFNGGANGTPFTSKVGFSRSKQGKCGDSWDQPQYLNKNYKQNQGTAMAVDPTTGKIYVFWHHFSVPGGDGFPDSILMVTSTDFGATFSAPSAVTGADFVPWDQDTISATADPNHVAFRSEAFPSAAVDGFGNVYVAIQEKVGTPVYYEPRVTIRTRKAGSNTWSAKSIVEQGPFPGGQQVMPSLTAAAGSVRVMWYDFRRPEWAAAGDPAWGHPSDCNPGTGDCFVTGLDRRMETRLAQSATNANGSLSFAPSVRVTKYSGDKPNTLGGLPAVNRPNLPMFVGGTVAFTGDYITAVSGSPFVANPAGTNPPFRWATLATDAPATSTLTVWSDSRDVLYPVGASGHPELSVANILGWQQYGPAGTGAASCINPGSRDLNVYFSEVKAGVIAGSPATSRQLVDGSGNPFERAFPFYVQNTTFRNKFFRLSFQKDSATLPVNGSFIQGSARTSAQPPAPVDVTIGPISTVSKTIYAYCPGCAASKAFGPFSIKVDEINAIGGSIVSGGLTTQLRFNSDPTAPFVTNPNLANQETHSVTFTAADWASADWASADWASADWASADWASADWASADWASADWASADWASADWASADWASADWASTSPVGDLVTAWSNVGNNASSYSVAVNIDPALAASLKARGYLAGLIVTRSYNKPNAFTADCQIQPIPLDQVISVIPVDLTNLSTTLVDTAGFASTPLTTGTLAAGNSSGAAEIQPDNVFVVLRLFGPRSGGNPPPPLSQQDQQSLISGTSTTVTPQAGDTAAGKQTATVTLSNLTRTYNGTPQMPTATTNPPGLNVVFTGAPQTNVGSYPVIATINDPNYQGTASGTFVIQRAPVTATAGSGSSTYDGLSHLPSACTLTGFSGGLTCANSPASVGPNAGTTTIVPIVSGSTIGNFSITYVNGSYTIAKAPSTTTFGPAPAASSPGGNFTVSATNNSGGTITYSKVSGPCTLVNASAGTFAPSGLGNCVVRADSATTQNYLASSAQQTVTIVFPGLLFAATDSDEFNSQPNQLATLTVVGSAVTGTTLTTTSFPMNGLASGGSFLFSGDPTSNTLRRVDFAGNLISSTTGGFPCCTGDNEDFAFDGSSLYHVHWEAFAGEIERLDPSTGAVLATYLAAAAGASEPVGITFVAGQIWVSRWRGLNGQGEVGAWDPGTNSFTHKFSLPNLGGGLAYDAANGILWVGQFGGWIEPYDLSGNVLGPGVQPFGAIDDTIDGLEFVPTTAGNALQFDGVGNFVNVPDSASLSLSDFTIEGWVKIDGPTFMRYPIVSKGSTNFGNYTLSILGNETGATPGTIEYAQQALPPFGNYSCGGGPITFGEWNHIAAVVSGSTVTIYLNGAVVQTCGALSPAPARTTNTDPLFIGRVTFGPGADQWFGGLIDEVRIWNVAQSTSQIAADFNHSVAADSAGLVGYWKLDEASGDQNVFDSTANGNSGTLGATAAPASDDPSRVISTAPITPPPS